MPFSTAEKLLPLARAAVAAAETIGAQAKARARDAVAAAGGVDQAQHAAHGLAWFSTYVEALRQMQRWAEQLQTQGKFGETEQLILRGALAEYCAQIVGGIPMSQGEIVRLADLGVSTADAGRFASGAVADLIAEGSEQSAKTRLAELIAANPNAVTFGEIGLDSDMGLVRDQFRKFVTRPGGASCARLAFEGSIDPDAGRRGDERAGRVRVDHSRSVRRRGTRQDRDVRRVRRAFARLYRRGLAGHAVGDRGRADSWRRHGGAEEILVAEDRRRARFCRRPCSPSRIPARTWERCARARCAKAMCGKSPATKLGSRMRRAPT